MVAKLHNEISESASERLATSDYHAAANEYTLAAHAALAEGRLENRLDTATGIHHLLMACIAYRLAGAEVQVQNRCKQGILLAEDLPNWSFDHPVQVGLAYELVGDFRTIGEFDDANEAYERALDGYGQTDGLEDEMGWLAEPEFDVTFGFFDRLRDAAGHDIDEETHTAIRARSLAKRIEYKKRHFATIVDTVVTEGTLG